MDRQMLSTMQEAMKVDIVELNKAEAFGALMAVFLWIYGFMSPIAGMIADRVNRKWLVVGSLFVWSGVTYLMGYADNFHELYWLRAVMGVSEALYILSALSLIADWHQGKSRSLSKERLIEVSWGEAPEDTLYPMEILVLARDRIGLLKDVTDVFIRLKINITNVNTQTVKNVARLKFGVEVAGAALMQQALKEILEVKGVISAHRS